MQFRGSLKPRLLFHEQNSDCSIKKMYMYLVQKNIVCYIDLFIVTDLLHIMWWSSV